MNKRLFIGCEVDAPWPDNWPPGKVMESDARHLTLLFLGEQKIEEVKALIDKMPRPSFPLGAMGYFSELLFLPPNDVRVIAWKMKSVNYEEELFAYQKKMKCFFSERLMIDEYNRKEYLPHLTVCRQPREKRKWKKHFTPLPWVMKKMHLYETVASSKYRSIWSYPFLAPFVQTEQTGDIAFKIRGENFAQIEQAAQIALSYKCPEILAFVERTKDIESIDAVIANLNALLTDVRSPFKAINYRSEMKEIGEKLYEWEMIVQS